MSFDNPNQAPQIEDVADASGEGSTSNQPNFDEYILPQDTRPVITTTGSPEGSPILTATEPGGYQRYAQYGDTGERGTVTPAAGGDQYAQAGDNYGNHGETRNERPENGPQIIIGTRQEFKDAGIPGSRAHYSISARGDIVEQKPPKTENGQPDGKFKADQPIYIMIDAGGDNNVRPAQQDALRNLQNRVVQQVQRDYPPAREEGGLNIQRLQRRARADAGTDQATGLG